MNKITINQAKIRNINPEKLNQLIRDMCGPFVINQPVSVDSKTQAEECLQFETPHVQLLFNLL